MGERVLGIGLDLTQTSRIADAVEKHGQRFLDRIWLPDELAYCMANKNASVHLAARFAAKEAVSKAFGTGIGEHLGWLDMEVRKGSRNEPLLVFHGKGKTLAEERGVTRALLTLTHTSEHTAACCILIEQT
ncbi:MAG: holo-ACP synthase [bacterium]